MADQAAQFEDNQAMRGITLLVIGLAVFSVQDVIMKLFSDQMALQQVIFLRGLVTLAVIALLLFHAGGGAAFVTRRPVVSMLRGAAGFICFTTFSMALAQLPLADAMPLYYTSPLFVMALSIPLLGEKVGPRSWAAILVGFTGVVLVARPGAAGMDPAMILALVSALAYSAQSLLARLLGATESALGMTFYSMLTFILLSGACGLAFGSGWLDGYDHPSAQYLFRAWTLPSTDQWWMIIAVGLVAAVGFICISQAYRVARASVIAPFEYSSLPFAVFWGWLFWGELPGPATLAGSLLIVGGGLYVLRREMATGRTLIRRRALRRQP